MIKPVIKPVIKPAIKPMIRPPRQADIQALAEIEPQMTTEELARLMSKPAFAGVVATSDETIEGVIKGFVIGWSTHGRGEIIQITVADHFRRQGVATALLKKFRYDYGEYGCWLDVRADNVPALELYAHAGFIEDSRRKDYYRIDGGGPVDAILMHAPPIKL